MVCAHVTRAKTTLSNHLIVFNLYILYVVQSSLVWLMVFNATFNNISVLSWQSVLLVEKTGVLEEYYRPVAGH